MSLRSLDAKSYAEDVKKLRQEFLAILPTYTRGTLADLVTRFKPKSSGIHYRWMVTPLLAIERCDVSDQVILANALQWVSFDTKLNMADADFSAELSVEYLDDEFAMSRYVYDESLVSTMRGIISEWTEAMETPPECAPWHFRHGNGATVEVSRAKASPIRKSLFFRLSEDDRAYLEWRGSVEDLDYRDLTIAPSLQEEQPIVVDFVPKSPLTNRVISKEHVTKMWLQNDLFWLMDTMFHESHVNVHLHNQEASRQLALEGSATGRYDTFDYSKASDFVTNDLVSRITEGTWLHDPLQWSRSKSVTVGRSSRKHVGLTGGEVTIPLAKFAPMGSSTCFPTESMVFAALCEVAVRRKLHRKSRRGDYLVYGDDVVIRSDCSDELRFCSALLHFKVNDDKTCRETGNVIYREACGIEAMNGLDVTPLRVSRRYVGIVNAVSSKTTTPGEYVGICDFVNRCYLYAFTNLRKYLCSLLTLWPRYYAILRVSRSDFSDAQRRWTQGLQAEINLPTPFFIVDDCTNTNYRVPHRQVMKVSDKSKASCYQTPEVQVWTVTAKDTALTDVDPAFAEDTRYWLWLLQAQQRECELRSDIDFLKVVERKSASGSGILRWTRRWVPLF
jgi:hypothetical protein